MAAGWPWWGNVLGWGVIGGTAAAWYFRRRTAASAAHVRQTVMETTGLTRDGRLFLARTRGERLAWGTVFVGFGIALGLVIGVALTVVDYVLNRL